MGREAASSAFSRFGQRLRHRQVLLRLDATTDGDNPRGLSQVDRLLGLLERRFRRLADRRRDRSPPACGTSADGVVPRAPGPLETRQSEP